MYSILRSMAVIGLIAWNSPVVSGRSAGSDGHPAPKPAAGPARPVPPRGLDIAALAAGGTATREALEILSNLDPDTRNRLIETGLRTGSTLR